MDYDWACRDVAVVVLGCRCGGANCGLREGAHHRVNGVAPMAGQWAEHFPPGTVWLTFDSLPVLDGVPGWPSAYFRKLRKSSVDIFTLADAPAPKEPALT
jgi:hypothetical protein